MRFVFSRRFFFLIAIGFIPLSLSWNLPWLRWVVLAADVALLLLALTDWLTSRKLPEGLTMNRLIDKRFAIGDPIL